jgi:hypothetical protein
VLETYGAALEVLETYGAALEVLETYGAALEVLETYGAALVVDGVSVSVTGAEQSGGGALSVLS